MAPTLPLIRSQSLDDKLLRAEIVKTNAHHFPLRKLSRMQKKMAPVLLSALQEPFLMPP